MSDAPDSPTLINGLIATMEGAAAVTERSCNEHDLPFSDAMVMVGINGAYIHAIVKALHELKAASSRIDILESQLAKIKG